MFRGLLCILAFLAPAVALAQAEPPPPISVTLHPQALPVRALRYHLLPEQSERTPGNAAPIYKRVIEMLGKVPADTQEQMREWSEMPLATFPREEVRKFLQPYQETFRLIDQAAHCEYCDWGLAERLRKDGIGVLLPEIQAMRQVVLHLSLQTRLQMAQGKWDDALRSIQTGLAMAKHTGETPPLITYLVGIAISTIMLNQVDEFIQHPEAPNLYWALTDLPHPFLDIRKAIQGERLMVYGTFPGVGEALNNPNVGPMSPQQVEKCVKALENGMLELLGFRNRVVLGTLIRTKHEAAQRVLIAQGRPRELVEKMPHIQVALLHALSQYDELLDDLIKWQTLPFWEGYPHYKDAPTRQTLQMYNTPDSPALPLGRYLLPAVEKVFFARARLDRKIASLRCLEAIRLHATHGGKLPATLADLKEVPLPVDPVTGKSFAYRLSGEVATLAGPPPRTQTPNIGNSLSYEIELKR
jgi:hypothetical protein